MSMPVQIVEADSFLFLLSSMTMFSMREFIAYIHEANE
ncbi:hypothetical protein SD77_3018 [Bacillus badius]|uniref:Uncharacterized protein n=1 Tax=Bacillus badius TaxID=1455 RepID=A0ABR5AP36_BACBA|nr:hypothetical protein SD77_3018 [Bacillus badius]